ncbi:hypothetical protein TNCV_2886951 [Trichonephila clavipes]|nr:hypothetical protein TNCV_2886951 [Trichonephila clavipes]
MATVDFLHHENPPTRAGVKPKPWVQKASTNQLRHAAESTSRDKTEQSQAEAGRLYFIGSFAAFEFFDFCVSKYIMACKDLESTPRDVGEREGRLAMFKFP